MSSPERPGLAGSGYLARNPSWHAEDSSWKGGEVARLLGRRGIRPRHVLEVGCGAGGVAAELLRLLPDIERMEGWDVSAEAIALALPKESPRLRFRNGDPLDPGAGMIPPPEGWDLLLALDVLEHVPDYLGFLAALRPLGRSKLFHVPLDLSVQSVLRASPLEAERRNVGHLHFFTRETALSALSDSGYRIVEASLTPASFARPRGGAKALAGRMGRRLVATLAGERMAARLLGGWSLMVLAE
jgi:SAM-dependent methyltransferase